MAKEARIIGDYTIEGRPLGSGGMATVYLVTKNRKKFAAKVLHKHLMRERKTVERFKQEFAIGESMKVHPAFVGMHELIKHDGCWTIIMEYVPGITLQDVLNKLGPLSPKEALCYAYELAAALEQFHIKNYVHRDLKPCNIMVSPNGSVKVMDYGVTRDLGSNLTKTGTAVGTPLYMAPEQICGSKSTDSRCDIYSLGLILFRLLSRRDAHGLTSKFELIDLIESRMKKPIKAIKNVEDEALMTLLKKCLEPDPDNRFTTTKELCTSISALKTFTSGRKTAIKKMLKTIETSSKKKPKNINIDKTIVQNPGKKLLRRLVLISGLAAATAIAIAFISMGPEKFMETIKGFFKQYFDLKK
ncbi:MAG: serine/threonine protein kinase [Lentisphaeraceae bacterium]|nr:serine/threonine protein kinase [Lentisphaeraceae bacterium]